MKTKNGSLHPVQSAMVKYHGSQCGFCTPGFVMSLFAMYKNHSSYNNQIIQDSIAGNLCRCTGYRPIIDAAKSLNNVNKFDQFKKNEKKTISLLKKIQGYDWSLNITNLFDEIYQRPHGYTQEGRQIKLGFIKKY